MRIFGIVASRMVARCSSTEGEARQPRQDLAASSSIAREMGATAVHGQSSKDCDRSEWAARRIVARPTSNHRAAYRRTKPTATRHSQLSRLVPDSAGAALPSPSVLLPARHHAATRRSPKILIVGSVHVIGQACESTIPAHRREALARWVRRSALNSNPATIMTDPSSPSAPTSNPRARDLARILAARTSRRVLPTLAARRLNLACPRRDGVLRSSDRAHRRVAPHSARPKIRSSKRRWIGSASPARVPARALGAEAVTSSRTWASPRSCARASPWRERRRHHLFARGTRTQVSWHCPRARRTRCWSKRACSLERIRARGHSRQGRQLHRGLLDRESRPDGRAHGDSITVARP